MHITVQRNSLVGDHFQPALDIGLASCFDLTGGDGGPSHFVVQVLLRNGNFAAFQLLLQQLALDHRLQHFFAVAIDAGLRQFADREVFAIHRGGNARHLAPFFRIAKRNYNFGTVVQFFVNPFGNFPCFSLADEFRQPIAHFIFAHSLGRRNTPFAFENNELALHFDHG